MRSHVEQNKVGEGLSMAEKNGFLVLDEKDWSDASPEQRDWYIYKTLRSMDDRLQALEGKSLLYRVYVSIGAVVGGMIGGLGAVFGLGK